jgi:ribosomal protein S18 acetylase RimI-like enzyme
VIEGEKMSLNELYYEEFIDRAEELEAVEKEIEDKEKEAEGKELGEFELRKLLEEPYLKKIGTQIRAARLFHPMSELGRMALAAAADTEKTYEERAGSLISRVTDDSVNRYKPLLSDDIMEDLLVNNMKAIGALRYRDGAVYAAGILAYGVEPDRAAESTVLRIHWLYVAAEFREQGIADMLLANIIAEGLNAGIDYFTFDFQDEKPETQVFYNLFSDWHFSFEEGLAPEFMTALKAKDESKIVANLAEDSVSLEALSEKEKEEAIKTLADTDPAMQKIMKKRVPPNYYDGKLSCVCMRKGKKGGVLLAHKMPGGLIRTEYLGWTEGGGYAVRSLVSRLAVMARKVYGENALISLPVETEELGAFLDGNFPEHIRKPMIEASLAEPLPDENADIGIATVILGDHLIQG